MLYNAQGMNTLEADEIGVNHISQCSALKVIDFSVMNAVTLLCVTNKINRNNPKKKKQNCITLDKN